VSISPVVLVFDFSPVRYSADEGSPTDITVVATGETSIPISVTFSTSDGTAIGQFTVTVAYTGNKIFGSGIFNFDYMYNIILNTLIEMF